MILDIFYSRQFLYFIAFGGTSAVVNLVCGYALYHTRLLPYSVAVFLGAASAMLVNFLLNYHFNFKGKELGRSIFDQFGTFFVVASIGILLTTLLARLALAALHGMGFHGISPYGRTLSAEFLAHLFAVGAVTFYSFVGHKYFSFNVGIRGQLRRALMHWQGGR